MKYYFVQHGKAVTRDIDESRPLSEDGIAETRNIANHLRDKGIRPAQIFHSGKERAQQTAALIAEATDVDSVSETSGMNPNDDVELFAKSQLASATGDTMFIGHLPHLDKLVSYLLTGDDAMNCIAFQNSAVVCIESDENGARILWYLTPSMI